MGCSSPGVNIVPVRQSIATQTRMSYVQSLQDGSQEEEWEIISDENESVEQYVDRDRNDEDSYDSDISSSDSESGESNTDNGEDESDSSDTDGTLVQDENVHQDDDM